jgi:aryl-alcohol dehydrogenase-like predicted oxidoreductase
MEYRNLGRTGLKVSELCLGTMQWGWTADEKASCAVMDAFFEAGGNFLDTANVYSRWAPNNPGGVSEEIIGRWMKSRKNRRDMVVATKVRGTMWEGPNGAGLGRKHIMAAVEDSLQRLQTDYIDLYQAHAFDADVPIDETLQAFDDLVRQGKALYIGASNYPAWRLAQALAASVTPGWTRFVSFQPHYSLLHRGEFERELKPLCEYENVGVIPYSPLAKGFLTGKYQRNGTGGTSVRAEEVKREYGADERAWEVLAAVQKIASERSQTPTQVALAWLLSQPVITSPIIGANSVAQLQDSMGAVGLRLSMEEMQQLDEVSGGPFSWND